MPNTPTADANVVAYRVSKNLVEAYWSSSTKDRATALPLRLCMQADGNLVSGAKAAVRSSSGRLMS